MTRTLIPTSAAHVRAGNAASTGIGLGLGLVLANCLFQATNPPERATKQFIVCLNCRCRNPAGNNYCWQCGQAFYPLLTTQCAKCKAKVPSMTYCGNCGSKLRKSKQKQKRVFVAKPVSRHSCHRTSFPQRSSYCIWDS